jgi:hypothetical protein
MCSGAKRKLTRTVPVDGELKDKEVEEYSAQPPYLSSSQSVYLFETIRADIKTVTPGWW